MNRGDHQTVLVDAMLSPNIGEPDPGQANRVVVIGNRLFNLRLSKLVQQQTGFEVVAMAETLMTALAYPKEHNAELIVIDADFGGPAQGVEFGRDLAERFPGRAFMIVCGPFTSSVARSLWVFGADSWSVITQATAQNPLLFVEAVSSAVHGIPWIEPGVRRELRSYGPRPNSLAERKLLIYERGQAA